MFSKHYNSFYNQLEVYILFNKFNIKKTAFTISEVLVTLGIIGVLAALTMPTLIKETTYTTLVTQSKKSYSTLLNALNSYKMDSGYGNYTDLISGSSNDVLDKLEPYIKYLKKCGDTTHGGCFDYSTDYNNGLGTRGFDNHYAKAILADGTTIAIATSATYIDIWFDANGNKKPNMWGVDIWWFKIYPDKITPVGNADVGDFPTLLKDGKITIYMNNVVKEKLP